MRNFTGQRTIPTFLDFHASTRPDVQAVAAESNAGVLQSLTWLQLQNQARQTANWLLALGLRKGDSVALHIPNSLDFYLVWLGACIAGVVTVPVDPRSTVAELNYIVGHSDARLVVTLDSTLDAARNASKGCGNVVRVVTASLGKKFEQSELGSEILAQSTSSPSLKPSPLDVAGMLYTSGTTGKPKGVMLTHAVYLYGAEVMARGTGLTQADQHLISLPLHHAAAQCHAMVPSLVTGASITILERFRPSKFMESAAKYRATKAALFAAPLRMLLGHHAKVPVPKTSLQLITFAQNLTSEEMSTWQTSFNIPLIQVWGMTETASLPLMTPLNGPRNVMCMGLPVAGYEVRIVDEKGSEVAHGESGEVVVRVDPGWSATPGYYKNPKATADLIHDGWLWSGDRAMQDENGEFHFLGRFKEMIKRSGENISPLEIEETLKLHPDVQDAAVVGVPDPLRDERVIAFVVLHSNLTDMQSLKEWCRERLSAFKVPEEFYVRDDFPRTSVGKLQRHLLRDAYLRDQGTLVSR
ncbi:MAG TPA: AMP-binding protein [Terriglobales bacterium]|jgi:crotonobetaine/carnitine-CoA ligase|nr:AMP-binding protein [Terriglobales bacterium]